MAELERKIGQQAMEIDFFEGLLATDRRTAEVAGTDTHSAICRKIHEEQQRKGPLTVQQMTALAGVSHATFYRFDAEVIPAVRDVDLRDAIQLIALQFPAYGRPRITAELKRQGWQVNHKRIGRILREDSPARLSCHRASDAGGDMHIPIWRSARSCAGATLRHTSDTPRMLGYSCPSLRKGKISIEKLHHLSANH